MTLKDKKEFVKGMSVLELNDLVKAIEEEFGVTAHLPVAKIISERNQEDLPEPSDLTLDKIEKKINQFKTITKMTFEEYKEACQLGKVKNYSSVGLNIWESLEEQKKELLKNDRGR